MQSPYTRLNYLVFPLVSFIIGYLSWGFLKTPYLMPLAFLVFPLWFYSSSRFKAFLVAFCYALGAVRDIPFAINIYFDNLFKGWLFIVVALVLGSLPFYVLHFKGLKSRSLGLFSILIVTSIPPLGIIVWANPLATTGIFWPSGGFIALILLLLLVPLMVRVWPVFFFPVIISLLMTHNLDNSIPNWKGINTNYHALTDIVDTYKRQQLILNDLNKLEHKDLKMIVFPETVTGLWLSGNEDFWKSSYQFDTPVLIGAIELKKNQKLVNTVRLFEKGKSKVVYRQRQPVPIAMWLPFDKGAYIASIDDLKQSSHVIQGKKVSFLLCFENYLIYPMLLSALDKPDYLVSLSNLWVVKKENDSPRIIQRHLAYSWSRLFDLPFIYAENI